MTRSQPRKRTAARRGRFKQPDCRSVHREILHSAIHSFSEWPRSVARLGNARLEGPPSCHLRIQITNVRIADELNSANSWPRGARRKLLPCSLPTGCAPRGARWRKSVSFLLFTLSPPFCNCQGRFVSNLTESNVPQIRWFPFLRDPVRFSAVQVSQGATEGCKQTAAGRFSPSKYARRRMAT